RWLSNIHTIGSRPLPNCHFERFPGPILAGALSGCPFDSVFGLNRPSGTTRPISLSSSPSLNVFFTLAPAHNKSPHPTACIAPTESQNRRCDDLYSRSAEVFIPTRGLINPTSNVVRRAGRIEYSTHTGIATRNATRIAPTTV